MAPEDGATSMSRNTTAGGGGGSVARMSGGQVLKKGPWTAAEDAVLMEYVKKHGEGNWNAVQRNSGLMRCGKSCRLRWANHLRPNLRKGAFTPEEERQIIELHSKFGNKWARMALHLQGRTDNEIKNYWNTRLKRRLRAGLPIYPVDFQQHHHRRHQEQSLHQNQKNPFSSSSSSSNHANDGLNSISQMLYDPMNYPVINTPFYLQNSQSHFKINGHSNNQISNKNNSPSFFNQGFPSSLQSNHTMLQIPKTEPSYNDVKMFENVENDLPSIQSSFQVITPTCSSNTVNDHLMVPSNDGSDNAISPYMCPRENSGLLEDVLGESRAIINSQILSKESKSSETDKGKDTITHDDYSLMKEPENVTLESVFEPRDDTNKTPLEDSSSGHSSIENGANAQNDTFDEINVTDDDFSSWLDFPTGSLQDWYGGNEDASNEKLPVDVSNVNTVGEENQVEIPCSPDATAETDQDQDQDHDWTMGSCCWNNMPGFS
uniref:transcription factor MYB97-like n=1 Tax=Erigeron canadensis TaxID=72917 RepID=UPI001CB9A9E1|nr:transcription factor MYB97-like [Erigeron canadensis]